MNSKTFEIIEWYDYKFSFALTEITIVFDFIVKCYIMRNTMLFVSIFVTY